jgi:hypothetical protein
VPNGIWLVIAYKQMRVLGNLPDGMTEIGQLQRRYRVQLDASRYRCPDFHCEGLRIELSDSADLSVRDEPVPMVSSSPSIRLGLLTRARLVYCKTPSHECTRFISHWSSLLSWPNVVAS